MFVAAKHLAIFAIAYLPGAPLFDGYRPAFLDMPLQRLHYGLHSGLGTAVRYVADVVRDPSQLPFIGETLARIALS